MDFLPELVRYHIRVNERILDQSTKLTEDEFRRPGTTDNGSAHDTLLHMLDRRLELAGVLHRER